MTQPSNRRLLTEDQVAPLSSATPAAPGITATGGSLTTASRSDHSHPAAGLFSWYGDGSDGDLTLDGTSTVTGFTRTGTVYVANLMINADDLTILTGVTLRPGGNVINVKGVLSGAGTITADVGKVLNNRYGMLKPGGTGPTGTTGAGSNTVESGGPESSTSAGGSGGAGGSAAGVGAQNNNQFTTGGTLLRNIRNPIIAFYGVMTYSDWAQTTPASVVTALAGGPSGASGGGGGAGVLGGTGGSGGQALIVNARKITGTLTISAPGGAGGAASGAGNAGGGGGGGGGLALLNTTDLTTWTGTITAPGGAGGAKVGTGVVGSAGTTGIAISQTWV